MDVVLGGGGIHEGGTDYFYDNANFGLGLGDGGSSGGGGSSSGSAGFNGGSPVTISSGGGSINFGWPDVPAAPVAEFTSELQCYGIVKFTDRSLGEVKQRLWSFGDGTTSSLQNPFHSYQLPGTYTVSLSVMNSGGVDVVEHAVVVTIVARTLEFTFVSAGFTAQFDFAGNFDADVLWDFDDGTVSTERNPKHIFPGNGSYDVTLTSGGLSVTHVVNTDVALTLYWQDNSSDETGFKIEHAMGPSGPWTQIATVSAGVTQLEISNGEYGINTDEQNYFRVRAYNGFGDSGYSNTIPVLCSQT